jgi:CRISPR/Cas system CMR-associated protein Cmr1 (group 7 of RAMP superfamily)
MKKILKNSFVLYGLLLILGNFGSRSRRGFGSVMIEEMFREISHIILIA